MNINHLSEIRLSATHASMARHLGFEQGDPVMAGVWGRNDFPE
jgi:hypothetical protein